jgi:hypothetical protein
MVTKNICQFCCLNYKMAKSHSQREEKCNVWIIKYEMQMRVRKDYNKMKLTLKMLRKVTLGKVNILWEANIISETLFKIPMYKIESCNWF